jgi:hypothetical protein
MQTSLQEQQRPQSASKAEGQHIPHSTPSPPKLTTADTLFNIVQIHNIPTPHITYTTTTNYIKPSDTMIIIQNTSQRSKNDNKITRNKIHTAKDHYRTNHEKHNLLLIPNELLNHGKLKRNGAPSVHSPFAIACFQEHATTLSLKGAPT